MEAIWMSNDDPVARFFLNYVFPFIGASFVLFALRSTWLLRELKGNVSRAIVAFALPGIAALGFGGISAMLARPKDPLIVLQMGYEFPLRAADQISFGAISEYSLTELQNALIYTSDQPTVVLAFNVFVGVWFIECIIALLWPMQKQSQEDNIPKEAGEPLLRRL